MNCRPLILALALAGTTLACGPNKQTKVDTADTTDTAEPTPPPPPPPKCEALAEKCEAVGGKKARVAGVSLMLEPVVGWVYAQGEKATVSQSGDETACLALAGYEAGDGKDAKKFEGARQAELEVLMGEVNISLGKAKVAWKSPTDKLEVGDLKLDVWEVKGVTRGATKGDVLLVAGPPADGKALIAVGFVPKDDDQSGGKIVQALQTLAPGDAK